MERDSIVAITKEYVLARHVPVAKTVHVAASRHNNDGG